MRAPPYSSRLDEIFSREAIDDPYPLYARLRRECPMSRVADTGVHLVATWDLIDEALDREDDFSAHLTGVLVRGPHGLPTTLELAPSPASRVIATADEPAHAVHRAVVQRRLTPPNVTALEPEIRSWARDAVAEWLDGGAGDFIPVAEGIPARVVARLLGLPDGDVSRHRTWAMMGGDILAGDISQEQLITLSRESRRMGEYLAAHFERARTEPRADAEAPLLHWLARGVEAGDIATDEAVGIATVLFGAGGESTAALIGSVARRLAADPQLADRLRRDADLVPVFVEEVTRLETPFKFHYRVVRRQCELGSVSLRTGDRLMLLWASANRDASRIDDPDALRLDRRHPRDHMSFGRGAHFCIGAGLARLEAKIVCEELLAQTACLAPCPEPEPVYAKSIFVRRLERLPLCAIRSSR